MWFVVLITGRMPPVLYDAYAALLRYEVRFHAWFVMLTSEYAWGMLGDPSAPAAPAFAPPPFDTLRPPPRRASPGLRRHHRHHHRRPSRRPRRPRRSPTRRRRASGCPRPSPTRWLPRRSRPPAAPLWPPPQPPPAPPAYPPGAMPPPSSWERISAMPPGAALPPWGTLVLQGAARGWMIFAIVWGWILFVGQDVVQNLQAPTGTTTGRSR